MLASDVIKLAWPELEPGRLLGYGSYGAVYEAFDNGAPFAVKLCTVPRDGEPRPDDLRPDELEAFYEQLKKDYENEIRMMQKLSSHPNVVQVKDYRLLPHESGVGFYALYRMEELTPLGTLFADRYPAPAETRKLGTDLCRALEACEEQKMLHRDIKPDNIFVDTDGNYKLGDFGVARCLDNLTAFYSRHGTANYMAPEVAASARYDGRADLYSLGLVLYRQLNDFRLPFLSDKRLLSTSERSDALMMRLRGDVLPAPAHASEAFSAVILKACAFKAEDRFENAAQFREALEALTEEDLAAVNMPANAAIAVDNGASAAAGQAPAPAKSSENGTSAAASKKKTWLPVLLSVLALAIAVTALVPALKKRPEPSGNISREETSAAEESAPAESAVESAAESPDESGSGDDLICKTHTFTDWVLVNDRSADIGVETRYCTTCMTEETRRHEHTFSDWVIINEDSRMCYCTQCKLLRFDGYCTHPNALDCPTLPVTETRFETYLHNWGNQRVEDLASSYFIGTSYHCNVCHQPLIIPHFPSDPAYEKQADGTTVVRIHCLRCGWEFEGDSFIIEADGHYRSHLQHDVADDMYTLEGLTAEEAAKYHIVIECSCGETDFKEEHVFIDGRCLCGKKD